HDLADIVRTDTHSTTALVELHTYLGATAFHDFAVTVAAHPRVRRWVKLHPIADVVASNVRAMRAPSVRRELAVMDPHDHVAFRLVNESDLATVAELDDVERRAMVLVAHVFGVDGHGISER